MFTSTVKKSNVINNLLIPQSQNKALLNKINLDNNLKRPKTFLLDDSKKKLIPKFNEDRKKFYTKSELNFKPKYTEGINEQKNNNNNKNDFHSMRKEKCLQKLKDMIFSPGDINYTNEKEPKENGGTYNNYNLKYSKNIIKSINISKTTNSKMNLLPNKIDNKKTLVLDLDETLIHSAFEPFNPRDDITLTMKIKEEEIIIHVLKRPYLDEFLNIVTQKYEVVIFTASISDYANPLLDQLDPFKKISYRLFREHCTKADNGLFIKDLNRLGRNLKDVIIIDNNPVSFTTNKANGLPILTWHSIQSDNELIKLIPLLTYLSNVDDIRPVINKVVNGYYINYKEVNKIISNNNNNFPLNNNNNKDDDYFNNWFPTSIKRLEKKNSFNYSTNNKDKKDKEKNNECDKVNNIKRKESFDQLIKYKGLLGSKEEFNFDNYKKSKNTKMFSGFINNNDISNNINNNINNNIAKKSFFMETDKKVSKNLNSDFKNDNYYDDMYNSRLDKKRNHSSKNIIKINKNVNNENDFNYFNVKKIKNENIQNNNNKDISFTKYNMDTLDDSKLNKTDANINLNKNSNYQNIILNNNTNIINNNIYVINNKQSNINDENNNTIEYSNRHLFNIDINKSFKDGYKSANTFYNKKERSQSAEYKKRQVNHNDNLSKLMDNLINYNKENKKYNINSNQLISISDNSKYLNNQKLSINNKISHLINKKVSHTKDLFSLYNLRIDNEKTNFYKKNNFLHEFNKVNIYNINNIKYYGSYKNSKSNIYVDTGNNIDNYSNKNIKRTFLYDESNLKKKNSEYNNYKLGRHYTNINQSKAIKYLSINNNKMNIYK